MLTRSDTKRILAQLSWERSELDRQIADLESVAPQMGRPGPHFTVLCMHCKRILDPANDQWRHAELPSHLPYQVSHGLCPDCLQKHYSDSL